MRTLGKSQQHARIARVNSARDAAFLQNASYHGSEVDGYTIDKSLSNTKGTVYVNNKTGKVTVAFAGTQFGTSNGPSKVQKHYAGIENQYRAKHGLKPVELPKAGRTSFKQTMRDIGADFHIATGTEDSSSEFRKADEQYMAVTKKYGQQNVDVTGHSLGGAKAAYLSHKHGVHAETFNMGASVFGTEHWDLRNVDAHVTTGDAVPFGVNALKQQGTGINVIRYHQNVLNIIKDEAKKKAEEFVKGTATKKGVKSGLQSITEPGSSFDEAVKYGEARAGEALAAYEVVKEVATVEGKLHSSQQFVPQGRTDAAIQQEKPPDSKPIPAPPNSKPAGPTPTPAPPSSKPAGPTPTPAKPAQPTPPPPPPTPTPLPPTTNPSSGSGYRNRYHIGSGGI